MASKAPAYTPIFGDMPLRVSRPSGSGARNVAISCTTRRGTRQSQEDRLLICEDFYGHCVLAVFDGTVGDYASDFCQKNFLDHLAASASFQQLCQGLLTTQEEKDGKVAEPFCNLARGALKEALISTDEALIESCKVIRNDYASSTAVVALLTRTLVTVAHLGDSRVAIGRAGHQGVFVTEDHKADLLVERQRIESAGGSVVYLHQGKPFIRGGDFAQRQAKGDRPMQLNYSRAVSLKICVYNIMPLNCGLEKNLPCSSTFNRFCVEIALLLSLQTLTGFLFTWFFFFFVCNHACNQQKLLNSPINFLKMGGKDLKMFGLSREATLWQYHLDSRHAIVLASDGLWDTVSASNALHGAFRAREDAKSPSEYLVQMGLQGLQMRGSSDNVTVVVAFLDGQVNLP